MKLSSPTLSPPMVNASSALGDGLGRVGIAHQLLALLDHGLGQRLGEDALRQHELVRRAHPGLSGLIAGDQGHAHLKSRPGMGRQVLGGTPVDVLCVGARQLQRHDRRLEQGIGLILGVCVLAGRSRAARVLGADGNGSGGALGDRRCGDARPASLALGESEFRLGIGDAMIVVGAVDEAQGAARGGGRVAHQADGRRLVLDQVEAPLGDRLLRRCCTSALPGLVQRRG